MAQNLLTDNQADVEIDLTGFFANNSTMTRDTDEFLQGVASLKMVTANVGTTEGAFTGSAGVTASKDYTASVYLKGSGTVKILLIERNAADNADIGSTTLTDIVLASTWTRYSVSRSFGATGLNARLLLGTKDNVSITYYADKLQIEQSSTATPWRLPSRYGARNEDLNLLLLDD